ncbi:GIY-YIG nuclease family protein [Micromonospora carbonacea]|uniref:hypothetical protein n=1 Tax=Micromonospora carbonacea TaxID=47853 RepID=UPI0037200C12
MTSLYRLYDNEGCLLYVGIAYDFDARFAQHAARKHWWPQVARKDVTWFSNRIDALHAEARAIAAEGPIHNVRKGAHPIGLAVIHRHPPAKYAVPRGWTYPNPDRTLQLGESEKRAIVEEVRRWQSHAVVTDEGVMSGVMVPLGWFLEARTALGEPLTLNDLPRVEVDELWGTSELAR